MARGRMWGVLVAVALLTACQNATPEPTPTPATQPGQVVDYTANTCSGQFSETCDRRIESGILGQKRDVLVYLPPGYDAEADPYPLFVYFHGWGDNEQRAADVIVPLLERAITAGDLPPVVAAFPNVSIGGTGEDLPETDYDDGKGAWFINSNLGRHEDFIVNELIPWLRTTFNVRQDAAGTVLTGESHGGFGAVYVALRYPQITQTVAAFYPTLDFRYSCNGDPIADYDAACYQRLEEDRPEMIISTDGRLTLERLYYTPFNSDTRPGPVWDGDLPTWQRFSAVNPVELLADESLDVSGFRFFIVAGDRDSLNYDAHMMAFLDMAKARGLTVEPSGANRRAGGHEAAFIQANAEEALRWLGAQLQAGERAQ